MKEEEESKKPRNKRNRMEAERRKKLIGKKQEA
jgi:hypothetical protein